MVGREAPNLQTRLHAELATRSKAWGYFGYFVHVKVIQSSL